jgi:hypothetical protein
MAQERDATRTGDVRKRMNTAASQLLADLELRVPAVSSALLPRNDRACVQYGGADADCSESSASPAQRGIQC